MTTRRHIRIEPLPPMAGPADAPADPARRALLQWLGAAAALAAGGCSGPPAEPVLPYVRMPEGMVPGEPVFYAATLLRDGYAQGVLVETHTGLPAKVEGNPSHPATLGAADAVAQAAILQLWDPDRSTHVAHGAAIAARQDFRQALRARLDGVGDGAGLRLLTGTVTSPTLLRQIGELRRRYPAMRWHRHDPARDAAAEEGAQRAFGRPARAVYRLDRARVVAVFGADPFAEGPAAARQARDFAQARQASQRARLYVAETTPGLAGAKADGRLARMPAEIDALLLRLARRLGAAPGTPDPDHPDARWIDALAAQLAAQRGHGAVIAGPALTPASHELAWRIDAALGNLGRTVEAMPVFGDEAGADADTGAGPDANAGPEELPALVADMRAGRVDTLVMVDTNPAYDAPGELAFADALSRVPFSVHLGLYRDETGRAAAWHLPRAHDFEDWGDARAWDGTACIAQPVIAPLYGGWSPHTLLGLLIRDEDASAWDHVRATWRQQWGDGFDDRWTAALRAGYIADSRPAPLPGPAAAPPSETGAAFHAPDRQGAPEADAAQAATAGARHEPASALALTAVFVPDPSSGTGSRANNAWLQELPRPFTQITWDNAALLGPRTARAAGVSSGDVVRISSAGGGAVEAPVFVLRRHAEGALTLPLGHGRRHAGRVGDGVGFDAYPLQRIGPSGAPLPTAAVTIAPTGRRHAFARSQTETATHGRDIVRTRTPEQAAGERPPPQPPPSLYPPVAYPGYAWGMTIDLDACIGCNACSVACQAENNIPVVGPEEVARGRIMHWIRIDHYDDGPGAAPAFQPVACMHCENAPCELVCPVGATMHDPEGLNVQVYNRCVGTRFCSNNCPYKVRRFNFRQYSDRTDPHAAAARNPDVTVRQRGVMEKCTYCLQRISRARIEAEKQGRRIADGEVVTACEAACPTRAIVFGNLNDAASRVARTRRQARAYELLAELDTRPRTSYLARIGDPDAALEGSDD
ncbi:TAT-variant-translocated molybdopterin oxidoreductase [Pigmentiphaga soli]|uniref:TAT-variant-translocated molybdopterin oxidoreductase n=1 Tax=Pigmentiphaga soli TaxID=1007095 RepID=A0ABP8GP98_9BURK